MEGKKQDKRYKLEKNVRNRDNITPIFGSGYKIVDYCNVARITAMKYCHDTNVARTYFCIIIL